VIILVVILLLGLVAPFVAIYGTLAWLLFIPVGATINYVRPFWLRLSPQHRHTIKRTTVWTLSLTFWISILYALSHSSN
jgi:hypothetical protein